MRLAGRGVAPPLDARESALDPRSVALDSERRAGARHLEFVALPIVAPPHECGHEVLGVREQEDVGFAVILVERQPLVGLAGDGGGGEVPAEAERAVAGAGVIGERQLRSEAGAPRAGGDGHRERARAGDRVGPEFLADAADGAATLGQRE